MFNRVGRAVLRPIFDQKSRRDGKVSHELQESLRWWLAVLHAGITEDRRWAEPGGNIVQLLCDASSSPPEVGAVLLIDDTCYFTHMSVPHNVVDMFRRREDNQIMALELLGISLGLCTFQAELKGRRVVIHCDNKGSEVHFAFIRHVNVIVVACSAWLSAWISKIL